MKTQKELKSLILKIEESMKHYREKSFIVSDTFKYSYFKIALDKEFKLEYLNLLIIDDSFDIIRENSGQSDLSDERILEFRVHRIIYNMLNLVESQVYSHECNDIKIKAMSKVLVSFTGEFNLLNVINKYGDKSLS